MKKLYLVLGFILVSLFLLNGCQEEPEIPEGPMQPEGFAELIQAYKDGKIFESARHRSGCCVLNFTDGSALTIAETSFEIHDCTQNKPAKVQASGNWWTHLDNSLYTPYMAYHKIPM